MMKKIVSGIIALSLVFGSAAVLPQGSLFEQASVSASSATSGNYYGFDYTSYEDGTTLLTKYYEDSDTTITIPSSVNGSSKIALSTALTRYLNEETPAVALKIGPESSAFTSYADVYTAYEGAVYTSLRGQENPKYRLNIIPNGMKLLKIRENMESLLNFYDVPVVASHQNIAGIEMPSKIDTLGPYSLFNLSGLIRVEFPKKCDITLEELEESMLGYYRKEGGFTKNTSFVISCYKGSAAEKYAKNNGFRCWLVDADNDSSSNGLIDINDMDITFSTKKYVCTGKDIKPSVTIKNGRDKLVEGVDYEITTAGTKVIGMGSVTIKGKGNYTGTYNEQITIIPANVTGFNSSAFSKSAVELRWNKVTGADGYIIYKLDEAKHAWVRAAVLEGGDITQHFFWALDSGTTYRYAIKAFGVAGANKVVASAKYPQTIVSTKPEKVSFKVTAGSKKATVKWSKVANATGYKVYYKTSKNGKWKGLSTTKGTSYTKTGLKSGQTYYFLVKSYRTVNGVTYLGEYDVKSVKVK